MGAGMMSRCVGFVAVIGLILELLSSHAVAETNDDAFNQCLQTLHQSQYRLTNEPWHSSRLPNDIEKIVQAHLDGHCIVRWTDHKNQNGSTTYVVLTRDSDSAQMAFDPDSFDVIFEQGNSASIKDFVRTSAFAFSATQRHGVNGLLFCTYGEISDAVLKWTGSNWSLN